MTVTTVNEDAGDRDDAFDAPVTVLDTRGSRRSPSRAPDGRTHPHQNLAIRYPAGLLNCLSAQRYRKRARATPANSRPCSAIAIVTAGPLFYSFLRKALPYSSR
jgi:hypothetical protein